MFIVRSAIQEESKQERQTNLNLRSITPPPPPLALTFRAPRRQRRIKTTQKTHHHALRLALAWQRSNRLLHFSWAQKQSAKPNSEKKQPSFRVYKEIFYVPTIFRRSAGGRGAGGGGATLAIQQARASALVLPHQAETQPNDTTQKKKKTTEAEL